MAAQEATPAVPSAGMARLIAKLRKPIEMMWKESTSVDSR